MSSRGHHTHPPRLEPRSPHQTSARCATRHGRAELSTTATLFLYTSVSIHCTSLYNNRDTQSVCLGVPLVHVPNYEVLDSILLLYRGQRHSKLCTTSTGERGQRAASPCKCNGIPVYRVLFLWEAKDVCGWLPLDQQHFFRAPPHTLSYILLVVKYCCVASRTHSRSCVCVSCPPVYDCASSRRCTYHT